MKVGCITILGSKTYRGSLRWFKIVAALFLLSLSTSAWSFNVLFVGNSFVGYSNSTLQRFAQASPLGEDVFGYEIAGGISLGEHARRAETLARIRDGKWDYVVLQDHSLQPIRHFAAFRSGLDQLIKATRDSGAEPILFMTWARLQSGNYPGDQTTVSNAYLQAATDHNVAIARIGDVFFDKYRNDSNLFFRMIDDDGIHPTSFGTFAVAASIYRVMYDDTLSWAPTSGVGTAGDRLRASAVALNTPREPHFNPSSASSSPPSLAAIFELLAD